MCGSIGEYEGDYEDGSPTFAPVTARARKPYVCAACRGHIPAGAYYTRFGYVEDGKADSLRMHIQCRDLCHEHRLVGWDVVLDAAENDEELGEDWLAHHRAVYEWAAGGRYDRGDRST